MLDGISNKVGFFIVFLSACCWVVYVVGFGLRYQHVEVEDASSNETVLSMTYFMHWAYAISSLPFYLAILVQFLCGNLFFSLIVSALAPLTIASVGGVLNRNGLMLFDYYVAQEVVDMQDYVIVEFAGALAALIFLWLSLMLWVVGMQRKKRNDDYEVVY